MGALPLNRIRPTHEPDRKHPFLGVIDRETPKDKALHLIVDNYATHKHTKGPDVAEAAPPVSYAFHTHEQSPAQYGETLLPRDHYQRKNPR